MVHVDPGELRETVVDGDPEGAGHVIVAGAGGAEVVGCVGYEVVARGAGEDAQRLEHGRDVGSVEPVVAVFPLHLDLGQVLGFELVEVDAGRRWADAGDERELGTGAGPSVEEAVEHAGARRLADGGGGASGVGIGAAGDIHTLTINEVWTRGKR